MNNTKLFFSFYLFFCCFNSIFGLNVDSLKQKLTQVHDTSRSKIFSQICNYYIDSDSVQYWDFSNQWLRYSKQNNLYNSEALVHKSRGYYYKSRGDFNDALTEFHKSLEIVKKYNLTSELGDLYNNLGATYVDQGEYSLSHQYLLEALKVYEFSKNEPLKAKLLLNIGLVFFHQQNYKLALDYYNQSLLIREKINDTKGKALLYNNIGIVYYYLKEIDSCLIYFKKSLQIYTKLKEIREMARPIFNIAEIYYEMFRYDSSLFYYTKGYQIDSMLNDKANMAMTLNNISKLQISLNQINQALSNGKKAETLALKCNSKLILSDVYENLANIYSSLNQYDDAYKYSNQNRQLKDTLFSKQSSELIAEMQTKYETEKKDILLSKQKETIAHQKRVALILTIGILLAVLLVTLITNLFIRLRKAFKILKFQKKNITDSINYASRIQTALLPPEEMLNHLLPGHFVLLMPRDIVSGDFYWITHSKGRTIIVVADCTGHGVPGAFMSMLGFAFLNEIIIKNPGIQSHEILNELRLKVKTSLRQEEHSKTKDGMDVALAIIDTQQKTLQYAGANNPLFICRNNELIRFTPDRMPIGIHSIEKETFTAHESDLQTGDTIYMFSDGYTDQFGGPKMKKLGYTRFEQLLIAASKIEIKNQKDFFERSIREWMAKTDQMDDILVLGVKIE